MKALGIILLLFSSFATVAQTNLASVLKKLNKESVPYIKVNQLSKAKYIFLDAREPNEYKVSHLPNALLVGYNFFDQKKITSLLENKNAPIVVYCSIGVRSEKIAEKLKKMGYKNVSNLYGGIFEYKNSGQKVYQSANKETDSVHTYNKEWSVYLTKGIKVYEN